MGLDVSLYKFEDYKGTMAKEKAANDFSEKTWNEQGKGLKYEAIPESTKDAIRYINDAYNEKHGLGKYGEVLPPEKIQIEIGDSEFPDHLFKIGYFRSSYNEGGINSILRNFGLPDLAQMFNLPKEEEERDSCFLVNWKAAKKRVQKVLDSLNEIIAKNENFSVTQIGNPYMGLNTTINDEKAALDTFLDKFREHSKREKNPNFPMDSFSDRNGHFFLGETPLQVVGAIEGVNKFNQRPCIYLIYKSQSENGESSLQWYVNALKIVIRTCDYVLNQPKEEQHKYRLSWSG